MTLTVTIPSAARMAAHDRNSGRVPDARTIARSSVVVIGMARSGLAAAGLLAERGARVFISDAAPAEKLGEAVAALDRRQIRYETGCHSPACLEQADFVVASPGVANDNILMAAARERGIPVFSEIEAAFWLSAAPILAFVVVLLGRPGGLRPLGGSSELPGAAGGVCGREQHSGNRRCRVDCPSRPPPELDCRPRQGTLAQTRTTLATETSPLIPEAQK